MYLLCWSICLNILTPLFFLIGIFVLALLNFESSGYNFSFKYTIWNISSQTMACLFILLTVYFEEHKFLIFMKSIYHFFTFVYHAFDVITKKSSLPMMFDFICQLGLAMVPRFDRSELRCTFLHHWRLACRLRRWWGAEGARCCHHHAWCSSWPGAEWGSWSRIAEELTLWGQWGLNGLLPTLRFLLVCGRAL